MRTEFENKISDKAGQFSLQPDEATWNKIADAINKKNRRRFLFWWILSGIVITGGAACIYLNDCTDNSLKVNAKHSSNKVQLQQEESEKLKATLQSDNVESGIEKAKVKPQTRIADRPSAYTVSDGKSKIHHRKESVTTVRSTNSSSQTEEHSFSLVKTDEIQVEEKILRDSVNEAISFSPDTLNAKIEAEDDSSKKRISMLYAEAEMDSMPGIKSVNRIPKRWSIRVGVLGGSGKNFYKEDNQYKTIADFRGEHVVKGVMSYTYELTINYHVTELMFVSAGVGYHQMNIKNYNQHPLYKVDTIFSPVSGPLPYQLQTVPWYGMMDSSGGFYINEQFNYLQFPVAFGVGYNDKKLGIHLSVPIGPAMLLSSDYYEYDFSKNRYYRTDNNDNLRIWNMFLGLSGDVNYNFARSFGCYFGFETKAYLFSLQKKEYLLEQRHSEYGLKAGLIYFIK